MSSAVNEPSGSATTGTALRAVRVLRAIVLVLLGFGIAFSAPLHAQLSFDRWMLVGGLALIGAATVAEYVVLRATARGWLVAVRAIVAFAAAAAIALSASIGAVAWVLAIWGVLNAVIAFVRWASGSQARGVALPSAIFSIALAVVVLIVRDDPVAVIGFFGAYAVIRGVFLGIAAFDVARNPEPVDTGAPIDGHPTAA